MEIDKIAHEIYENAVAHGWYEEERNTAEVLALIHSEVSEALECWRINHDLLHVWYREEDLKPEGFFFEVADVIIRCLDLFAARGLNPSDYISEKHNFNLTRPYKHNKLA